MGKKGIKEGGERGQKAKTVKKSFGQLLPSSRLVQPKSKKSSKNSRRFACMSKEFLDKLK